MMQKKTMIITYWISFVLVTFVAILNLIINNNSSNWILTCFLLLFLGILVVTDKKLLTNLSKSAIKQQSDARETARKLSVAVESSHASIVITDKMGIIEYVNPQCYKLTGYSREELIGNNPRILQSPQNSKAMYASLWNDITNGKVWRGEFCNLKKNGEMYWESATISPIFDSNGSITHYIAVKEDITKEREIKQTLQNERKMLRTLIDNIPDLLYAKDLNACKTLANKADIALMGLNSEEECIGKDDSAFFPPEEARKYIKEDMLIMKTGIPTTNSENWNTNKFGEKRFYNTNKFPLKDKDDNIVGLVGIGRDITDVKLKEIELENLLKIQTTLVELFKSQPEDITKFIDMTLDSSITITGSPVGFILLFDEEKNRFNLTAWQNNLIESYFTLLPDQIKIIESLEIWNDISKNLGKIVEKNSNKYKELKDIFNLNNFTAIPITKGKHATAITVLGNKPTDYSESDINNIVLFLTSAWERVNTLSIEQVLRENEVRYRALFENSPDAYLILAEGFISDCNKATEKLLLLSKSEIIGKTFADISPEYQQDGKDSFSESKKLVTKAFENGNIIFEWLHQKSNGILFYAEIAIEVITLESKKSIFATIRDITGRKIAEKSLIKNEKRLKQAQAIGLIGNWEMDILTEQIIASEQALIICGIEYKLETDDYIQYQKQLSAFKPLIKRATNYIKESNKNFSSEVPIKRYNDNKKIWIHVKAELEINDQDKPIKISGTIQDITLRKLSEEALRQSERELRELNATKDKFFSIIAHDLKSPFNALLNLANMLITEYSELSEEEKLSFIESIDEISTSSYNLLENLLEWAGMQTGKMRFIPEKLNILVEIYPTLKLLVQSANNKNIEIVYFIDKTDEIIADKYMLNTVIRNLISNSIKFTNPRGKITLKAERKDNYFEISVSDNGVGMIDAKLSKIFRIEQNISTKGTANEKGTGLGLLLCKEMVEAMGGKIWVNSKVNEGTTFTFTIPTAN